MTKKFIYVLFAMILAVLMGLPALAEDINTKVDVEIPEWLSVTVNMSDGSSVIINGTECKNGDIATIPYNRRVIFEFFAADGMAVDTVILDSEDIGSLIVNNAYTAAGFRKDITLSMTQKEAPQADESSPIPPTGDKSNTLLWLLLGGTALIYLAFLNARKRNI